MRLEYEESGGTIHDFATYMINRAIHHQETITSSFDDLELIIFPDSTTREISYLYGLQRLKSNGRL